jgi:transposase
MGEKRQRRVFSAEFKSEAVRRLTERRAQGVPLTQIARELEVRANLLHRWQHQADTRAGRSLTDVFPGHGRLPSEAEELRQLRREVETLRQERDFLKRAAAFFARESR